MPVTIKDKNDPTGERKFTLFVEKNRWFTLDQTEGPDVEFPDTGDWNRGTALRELGLNVVPFDNLDGNVQGYAKHGTNKEFAINPLAQLPMKTSFHEMAHILLGHTVEGDMVDTDRTPRNIREVEAESVALLCCEALGLDGPEFSRGYIQNWYQGEEIPEASAKKIFRVADQILRAGRA